MGLTTAIGDFLAEMRPARVPEAARPILRTGFTDCLGVMLAGWHDAAPTLLRGMLPPCEAAEVAAFVATTILKAVRLI